MQQFPMQVITWKMRSSFETSPILFQVIRFLNSSMLFVILSNNLFTHLFIYSFIYVSICFRFLEQKICFNINLTTKGGQYSFGHTYFHIQKAH